MSVWTRQPAQYLEWLVEESDNVFPSRVVFEFKNLNKKQMDAVEKLFLRGDQTRPQRRLHCQFGLSFKRCELSVATLRLI